jgi:hypothetical protein
MMLAAALLLLIMMAKKRGPLVRAALFSYGPPYSASSSSGVRLLPLLHRAQHGIAIEWGSVQPDIEASVSCAQALSMRIQLLRSVPPDLNSPT